MDRKEFINTIKDLMINKRIESGYFKAKPQYLNTSITTNINMNEKSQFMQKERINKLLDKLVDAYIDWDVDMIIGVSETMHIVMKQYKEDTEKGYLR